MSSSPQYQPPQPHPMALRIFRFIIRYKRMNGGDTPSRREIAAGVGLESINTVQNHIENLETAGLIKRPQLGQARRIHIPGASWQYDESHICAKPADSGDGLEEGKKVG